MEPRRSALIVASLCVAVAATSIAAPPVPPALAAILAAQGVTQPATAWCRGEFREGAPEAFAVGLESSSGKGVYAVVERNAKAIQLATFAGRPSVDCYSRAEAEKLDASIRQSATIHGAIAPRWTTAVVCAFTDATSATCWQYSPADRAFVTIGRWTT